MINPTPYDAPTTTAYKPQPATQPAPPAESRTPGERIIAAEIQAQERNVSRMLLDEDFHRSAMINVQINRMRAEEAIARMRADLATLKARTR